MKLRSALQEEEMDPCDVALIWLLQQANCLKLYCSQHETDQLTTQLQERKKDPLYKQLAHAAAGVVAVN